MPGPEPRAFALAQGAWLLVALALAGLRLPDPPLAYLLWFGGFLVIAEVVPPSRLGPRSRRVLHGGAVLGYLLAAGAAVAVFA